MECEPEVYFRRREILHGERCGFQDFRPATSLHPLRCGCNFYLLFPTELRTGLSASRGTLRSSAAAQDRASASAAAVVAVLTAAAAAGRLRLAAAPAAAAAVLAAAAAVVVAAAVAAVVVALAWAWALAKRRPRG